MFYFLVGVALVVGMTCSRYRKSQTVGRSVGRSVGQSLDMHALVQTTRTAAATHCEEQARLRRKRPETYGKV